MEPQRNSFYGFLVIWTGQLLSRIGSGISTFALGMHLLQTPGITSAYALLLMAAFGLGGMLADHLFNPLLTTGAIS